MIKTNAISQQAVIGMPASWRDAVSAAAAHTFPAMGGVSVEAAAAGTKRRSGDVAPVCTYVRIADVLVLDGAFPGTSAWSPPI